MSKTVYVVQVPATREGGRWERWDISDAERFGRIVELLSPGNIWPDKLEAAMGRMIRSLATFDADDFLLLSGDPIAIGMAVALAYRKEPRPWVLKWDRHKREYIPFRLPTLEGVTQSPAPRYTPARMHEGGSDR